MCPGLVTGRLLGLDQGKPNAKLVVTLVLFLAVTRCSVKRMDDRWGYVVCGTCVRKYGLGCVRASRATLRVDLSSGTIEVRHGRGRSRRWTQLEALPWPPVVHCDHNHVFNNEDLQAAVEDAVLSALRIGATVGVLDPGRQGNSPGVARDLSGFYATNPVLWGPP